MLSQCEVVYFNLFMFKLLHFPGQRRLRLHNLALNTCMQMADLYRNCELDTIINFMAKQSISRSVETTPQDLKEAVVKR